MAKYKLIDDRYLEFTNEKDRVIRIDLDAMFKSTWVSYPDTSCQGKKGNHGSR